MANNKNLKQENKKVLKSLQDKYVKEYKKIKSMLSEDIKSKEQLEAILEDILALLFDAQEEGREPQEIYEGDFEEFYRNLLNALSSSVVTSEEKLKNKKRKNILIGLLSFLIVILVIAGVLWRNGTIGIWRYGMAFLETDSSYIVRSRELYNLNIEMQIDLNNLDSNVGKIIYNDGECKIEIKSVSYENGDYKVYFKSYGKYDRKGGILISPISHTNDSLKQDVFIQTNVDDDLNYLGKLYYSSSLLKYGDEYGFTILSSDILEEKIENKKVKDIIKQDGVKVKVTLSNFIKYTWTRKNIDSQYDDKVDGYITLKNIANEYLEKIYSVLNDDVEYKVLEFSLNMDENDNIRSLYFIIYEDMSNVSCYQIVYKDGKTDVNKMEDDFLKDYDQVELNQKNIYLDQFLAILEKVNFKKYKNANVYTYTYNKFDDNLINYDEVYKIDKNNNLKESNKSNDKKLQYIKCIAENNESTVKRVIYLISDK